MDQNQLFLLEFLGFSGIFLAWSCWELWKVRKGADDDKPSKSEPAATDAKPD